MSSRCPNMVCGTCRHWKQDPKDEEYGQCVEAIKQGICEDTFFDILMDDDCCEHWSKQNEKEMD